MQNVLQLETIFNVWNAHISKLYLAKNAIRNLLNFLSHTYTYIFAIYIFQ